MKSGVVALAGVVALGLMGSAQAETIKVGLSKLASYPATPIAIQRGYFKAQGIDAEMVFFDSAQPIAVAVTSGDIDFGVSGLSAGFYTLAGQGQLRLLAGSSGEQPGFYNLVFLESIKAFEGGLKEAKNLPGHSIGVTQVGTSLHYSAGLVADKYNFDFKSLNMKPLQSNSNVISALTGGTIDVGILPATPALPLIQKGTIKVLGWVGDLAPGWTGSAAFTSTKTANDRGDLVKRFLVAYRHGTQDYHDAFTGPGEKRQNGPGAPAMLTLLSNFTGVSTEDLDRATPYLDAQGRLDSTDIGRQITWYASQGLMKGEVKADQLIDSRYAIPLHAGK